MSTTSESATIVFMDIKYNIRALENCIGKAVHSEFDSKIGIHARAFDQARLPAEWKKKYRRPVLTLRDGMYVVIHNPYDVPLTLDLIELAGGSIMFVSKYSLNQARYDNVRAAIQAPSPSTSSYNNEGYKASSKPAYGTKSTQSRFNGRN